MISIHQLLNSYWNHTEFRELQENIINAVIENKDVLTLLPTGSGKSICFQIPALFKDGICIVISPLIALMEDQVQSLKNKGINAIALTSKYNREDSIRAFDNLRFGNYKFLYLSPEKLQSEFIQTKIKQLEVNLIAIDEAHCISEWGHDFRPAYQKISVLRELHPRVNFIALTASATERVMKDIIRNLAMNDVQTFKKSLARDNLVYKICKTENIQSKLKLLLNKIKEPVIVYAHSRKDCIDYSNFLNQHGFNSTFYHGGLSNEDKLQAFDSWMENKTPIIVATNAFGMGIDKSNVRAVIHLNVPNSIENYLQETGRAGRDFKESLAILIYNDATIFNSQNYLKLGISTLKAYGTVYEHLNQFFQIANGEMSKVEHHFNLQDFCLKYHLNLSRTQHILKTFHIENIVEIQPNAYKRSSVKIIVTNSSLFDYENKNKQIGLLLQVLLRNYGGIFDQFVHINESFLAKNLKVTKKQVISWLLRLNSDKMIIYKKATNDIILRFLLPREDRFVMNKIEPYILRNNQIKIEKSKAMIGYIKNDKICRNLQLREYFGEKDGMIPCDQCDVCAENHHQGNQIELEDINNHILKLFNSRQILGFEEIQNQLNYKKDDLVKTLQLMLEHETIRLTSLNKFEKLKNE